MKYNKSGETIQNISASISAIVTGFLIGLFVYGLLLTAPYILPKANIANADSLLASCSVTPVSATTATWTAAVSGGTGSVTYSWSGTEGLTNSTATVTKTYTTSGTKTGTVTITSGSSSSSATCSIIITISPQPAPQCSDGIDNDGDGLVDFPADSGCSSASDNDENSAPVITLVGNQTIQLTVGDSFTDPGATALDAEDGDITASIIASSTVNTAIVGTYVVTYNVSDSAGLAATEVTRSVVVSTATIPLSASCSVSPTATTTGATVTWSAVPIGATGSYTFVWSGTDSLTGSATTTSKSYLTAGTKTGSVIVISGTETVAPSCTNSVIISGPTISPQCSDGLDNDGDTLIDTDDPACHTDGDATNTSSYDASINDENSAPVITLVGNASISLTTGDNFTDPGATAADEEDGDITSSIVIAGDTVDTGTSGSYTITYNVSDSKGAAAVEVTRTVTVTDPITTPPTPPTPPPSPPGGGGGGGGGGGTPIRLEISNEKVEQIATSTALVTWDTNLQANGQVFYDIASHASSSLPFAEYAFSTSKTNTLVTNHSATITGLAHNVPYYFRPAAFRSVEEKGGIELTIILEGGFIAPPVVTQCQQYLFEHIKFGEDNNPAEVLKLQTFLNDFEGFNLEVNGIYDTPTFEAVEIFQNRYAEDILDPWGLETNTGYVYITTQKKINEIYCNNQIDFSLTEGEQMEVEEYNAFLNSLREQGLPLPDDSKVGLRKRQSAGTGIAKETTVEPDTNVAIDTTPSLSDIISDETFEDREVLTEGDEAMASVIGAIETDIKRTEAIKRFLRNISFGNFLRVLFHTVF